MARVRPLLQLQIDLYVSLFSGTSLPVTVLTPPCDAPAWCKPHVITLSGLSKVITMDIVVSYALFVRPVSFTIPRVYLRSVYTHETTVHCRELFSLTSP